MHVRQAEVELAQDTQLMSAQMTQSPEGLTEKEEFRHCPHSRSAEQVTQLGSLQRKQSPLKRVTFWPLVPAEVLQTLQTSATSQLEQRLTLQLS
jgi:hypothetical protein